MIGPSGIPIANTIAEARAMTPELRERRIVELREELRRGVAGPAKRAMRVQRARMREIERLEKVNATMAPRYCGICGDYCAHDGRCF